MGNNGEKVFLLSMPGCPGCASFKEFLKENNTEYKELNPGQDESGAKVAKELNIKTVPMAILVKGNRICRLNKDGKVSDCAQVEPSVIKQMEKEGEEPEWVKKKIY